MTESHEIEDVAVHNERSLQKLAWAIEASVGQFKLFLARCNYTSLRSQLVERLQELTSLKIRILELKTSEKTLFARIGAELNSEQPDALMVFGLESVANPDELLSATNQVREEFRKNFHFPLVLWVNDEVMEKLLRLAPDFESWAITTEFVVATDGLIDFLQKTTEQFFEGNLTLTGEACREVQLAYHELQGRQPGLDLELRASIESLLGLAESVNKNLDAALEHYQKGLELWQQSNHLERQVKLLIDIAFCYFIKTPRYREPDHPDLQATRRYVQQYFNIIEQINSPNLSANSILKLGDIFRDLQEWEQLQIIAQNALQHHQSQGKLIELAKDYGFLPEVALAQERWKDVCNLVKKALDVLGDIYYLRDLRSPDSLGSVYELIDVSVLLFDESRYLFILAKAQHHLGQTQEAIRNLQEARELGELGTPEKDQDPCLYLDILSHLHRLYFEQKEYLEAFKIKLEQRSIEQQYGFRAFVGAGRIQPRRQAKLALTQVESQEMIAPEITASGRQLDVERLIERIGRNDSKLIVIHGESGVGKSSLVNGGLVPALKQKVIGTSDVLPVPMRVYTNWVGELGKLLAGVLEEKGTQLTAPLDSEAAILAQLQQSESRNLRTVLIFDQFEEFFFVYPNPAKRRRFFEFVGACLNILPVKVILSLRKDYLHYLLECNRLPSMKIISNDILTKNVLYELGNFSPADAKAVIQRLTEVSNFHLEPALIEQLVQDLAGSVGEVRPIELQIAGAQLQTDNITTLIEYQRRGQKEELVKHYLAEVVSDCGAENKQAAELVLFLLTEEKGTRPLKTRAELERDLQALAAQADKLDLVLKIFVDSGLVVLLPELPADRYQLVHDYIAAFIRQKQGSELLQKLKEAEEQRKLNENLLTAASVIGRNLDVESTLRAFMDEARNLIQADRTTVFLLSKETEELWSIVSTADGRDKFEIRIPANRGIAGYVASTGETLNIPNAYKDPLFDPTTDKKTGYFTRNILAMPVFDSQSNLIGVTQLINKHQGSFTRTDEEIMELFNILAGTAVENAKLFENVLIEKQYLNDILQSLPIAVISTDMQGRVVTINDAALALLSYPQSNKDSENRQLWELKLTGHYVWEVLLIKNLQGFLSDCLTTGAKHYVSQQSLTAGLCINLRINPLTNREGTVRGGLVLLENLS